MAQMCQTVSVDMKNPPSPMYGGGGFFLLVCRCDYCAANCSSTV